ncbi:MAG: carbohydrate ABC transporter permease [Candidatus Bathyarchaeia archaeon]|nr:carbohydrate ABC transporter permease [Candidatus Bathyarchaeota archaeon]
MRKGTLTVVMTIISFAIVTLYLSPFIWMIGVSFKPIGEWGASYFFPQNPTLRNYMELATGAVYGVRGHFPSIIPYLINSFVSSSINSILTTLLGAMIAYTIQRYRFGGTRLATWILSLRMIPPVAVMLPLVVIVKSLGVYDSVWGLILIYPLITLPLTTWLMIGAIKNVPRETDEAALVDGCTEVEAFFKIVLPQTSAGLAASATIAFIFSWSEFLIPLLLTQSTKGMTLTVYAAYFAQEYGVLWGPMSAAGVVIALPVIVFAIIVHKYLVKGLTLAA